MASQFLRNTLQLVRPVVAGQYGRRNYGAAAAAATRAAPSSHSSSSDVRPPKKVDSSKHYLPGDFPNEQSLRISFPDHIHKEMSAYVRKVAKSKPNIDTMTVDTSQIPETQAFLKKIENDHILNGTGFVILPPIKGLETIPEMRLATFFMTACCGDPLVQNAEGNKGVLVYDRDSSRLMRDGQRYHQSHEGGSLHTDNVNVPDVWESMFLTCLYPAFLGGESIVVSATAVHNFLVEVAPEAIETLQRDYYFEYRGFSNKFYKAPILFYNARGEPCFRYLRDYMESAHKRLNTPLTQQQLLAIDLIDACNELSKFQIRTSFAKGETLWCNDVQTFHGRTRFVDSGKASLTYDLEKPQNRLYQRTWVKSDHKEFRGLNQSRYENIDA